MELFGKIWIQNVGDIDLKVISAAENSNKFQKSRFCKEKSVEDVVTLGPMAQATLVSIDLSILMKRTYSC
jgi:peroxiredoxin